MFFVPCTYVLHKPVHVYIAELAGCVYTARGARRGTGFLVLMQWRYVTTWGRYKQGHLQGMF